jgi:hypothetical protein
MWFMWSVSLLGEDLEESFPGFEVPEMNLISKEQLVC